MSQDLRYVCVDHDPPLHLEVAGSGQHTLQRMRQMYAARADLLAGIETLRHLDFDIWNFDPDENAAVKSFMEHPNCHLIAMDGTGHRATLAVDESGATS